MSKIGCHLQNGIHFTYALILLSTSTHTFCCLVTQAFSWFCTSFYCLSSSMNMRFGGKKVNGSQFYDLIAAQTYDYFDSHGMGLFD